MCDRNKHPKSRKNVKYFSKKCIRLREIRDKVYDLLINCIPGDLIIKFVLKELCNFVDTNWKYQMVYWAAYHENKMQMGNNPIFHIEAFLARMMFIYKKYAQDYGKQ